MAQSPCPEDINWIRYPVHSHYYIIPLDIHVDSVLRVIKTKGKYNTKEAGKDELIEG